MFKVKILVNVQFAVTFMYLGENSRSHKIQYVH